MILDEMDDKAWQKNDKILRLRSDTVIFLFWAARRVKFEFLRLPQEKTQASVKSQSNQK